MKTKEERKQRKAERKKKPHFVRHSFGMAFGGFSWEQLL